MLPTLWAFDGVSLVRAVVVFPGLRVQAVVAAVGETQEEVSALLLAVAVPRPHPDKRELPHMRVTEEGLGPRTVGEVAPPLELVRVRQVVQVLLPHRGAMGIAHVHEELVRGTVRNSIVDMGGEIGGCQRHALHRNACPCNEARVGP